MAQTYTTTNHFSMYSSNKSFALILILFQSFFLSPLILPTTKLKYPQILLCYIIFSLWLSNTALIFWQFWQHNLLFLEFTNVADIVLIVIAYVSVIIESWTYRQEHINVLQEIIELDQILELQFENFHRINLKEMTKNCRIVFYNFLLIFLGQIIGMTLIVPVVKWTEYGFCLSKIGLYLRMLQISFYADMMYQRLAYIDKLLLQVQFERDCNRIENVLSAAIIVYGKLWKIFSNINYIFGWSLAIINVEFMFNIISDAYLFYEEYNRSTKLTIGESVFRKCFLTHTFILKSKIFFL